MLTLSWNRRYWVLGIDNYGELQFNLVHLYIIRPLFYAFICSSQIDSTR